MGEDGGRDTPARGGATPLPSGPMPDPDDIKPEFIKKSKSSSSSSRYKRVTRPCSARRCGCVQPCRRVLLFFFFSGALRVP